MTSDGQERVPLMFREERPAGGRTLPVEAGTIGREGCAVNLADPEVSRRHAAIQAGVEGTPLTIVDLGSRNGTWVNDRRVEEPTSLHDGDVVRIGSTVLHVTTA
jgi:pSer/pThr/pTyr-binding forkhead associated (FHA) protein